MSVELVEAVRAGHRRALARLITRIENEAPDAADALAALYPHTGHAHLIGVTGPPGSGKSTLVNALALALRHGTDTRPPCTVAIVAVDPTSPFTGGALLGDRVRMRDLSGDPGVFIRSMATRGELGGLARTTSDVVTALDAAGFDVILIETVGAGQSEVDVARTAQTTLVIEAPGLGDDIQAIKAGILEIADILVVNKADQPGAEATTRALRAMLDLGHATRSYAGHHGLLERRAEPTQAPPASDYWHPPILQTSAHINQGIEELLATIARHRAHLTTSGEGARRAHERAVIELDHRLREALLARLLARVPAAELSAALARIVARTQTPHAVVTDLLART